MEFRKSSIENLRSLGYTQDEARFLYLVAMHSGYFSARQYLTFTGAKSGEKSMAFTQKVLGKGHAAARMLLRNGRVYHLYSRLVYRAIGREHLRNRREHSVEHMRTKLAILDFVLGHLDYRYLETEDDKVAYFCRDLGIARFVLPAKHYAGAIRERTTARHFVDKFPMFFPPESSSSPVVTFSFVDPGLLSLASFDTHLFAYSSLFSALPQVQFVYIATRPTHFEAARELFEVTAPRVTNPDPGVEGLRYFTYRRHWENKEYGKLNAEQVEYLKNATELYRDPRIEALYRPWLLGQIPVNAVTEEFRKVMGTAVNWEYISNNPVRGVKMPERTLKRPHRFLSAEEVQRLIASSKEPTRTIVILATMTGLRIGEILALRWGRIDLLRGTLLVAETCYKGHFGTPKTRASRREVPLAPAVVHELKERYIRSTDHSSRALVFATREGAPLAADNLRKKSLRTACKRAGLQRIDWHALRHTHGTLLHAQGTPLKVAQAQLGHSHMATTLEVYTHTSGSAQRDAVNMLADQLFPNVPKLDGSGNTAQEETQVIQ